MVPGWKNLHLRVFHCEIADSDSSLSISETHSSVSDFPRISDEHRIRKLLDSLRISASIQKIPNWSAQIAGLKGRSLIENRTDTSYESASESGDGELSNASRSYILR